MKKRSKIRLLSGKVYYSIKQYLYWWTHGSEFSKEKNREYLKYEIFSHKSLVMRKLEGVNEELQRNKFTNLNIALKTINGLIIKPGEKFSYWKCIGNPTERKGYKTGVILNHGKVIEGIGGGLCQLSNLLYWMFLHSEFTITKRFRHSYDVFPDHKRKVPFGVGSTCYFPFLDLEVCNTSSSDLQIVLFIEGEYLYGKILSASPKKYNYKIIEENHKILHLHKGTYTRHNEIYREKLDLEGTKIKKEFITENNAFMMYSPLIAYKEKYLIEEKNI